MRLDEFRKQYPQYNDLSDEQLASGLHKKYYSDIPIDQFNLTVGITKQADPSQITQANQAANAEQMTHDQPLTNADQLRLENLLQNPSVNLQSAMNRYGPEIPPQAKPLGEPTMAERVFNKLLGTRGEVNPENQAKALIAFQAMQQGQTPKQLVEEVGARTGPLERGIKDFGAGAVSSGAGMLGFAARFIDDPAAQDLFERADITAQDLMPANPNFLDQLAAGFGSTTATSFIPGLGIARGAQAVGAVAPRMGRWLGSSAAAGMEAAAEAGQTYEQMLAEGKSIEQAQAAADKVFWGNAALVGVTNRLGLFGDKGGQLVRRSLGAAMEGGQEGGQQVISNVAQGKPAGEGVGESALIGAIVGGTMSGNLPASMAEQDVKPDTQTIDPALIAQGNELLDAKAVTGKSIEKAVESMEEGETPETQGRYVFEDTGTDSMAMPPPTTANTTKQGPADAGLSRSAPNTLPETISAGPMTAKTTPIGGSVFRETDAEGLNDLLLDDMRGGVRNTFVTDDKTLAIGQGSNKGVMVEFSGDLVSGIEHNKPGTGIIGGKEYQTNFIGKDSIQKVTIAPGVKVSRGLTRRLLRQRFERHNRDDGSIVYTKPVKIEDLPFDEAGPEYSKAPNASQPADQMQPGSSYVGMIEDTYEAGQTAPKPAKTPLRREEILKPFLKALGVPLYQGKKNFGAKNALGYYLPQREAVRVLKKNDLEVTAHELAHLIDDRLWRKDGSHRPHKQPWLVGPKHRAYARELQGLSYDRKKVYEGFAEFVRHWMTKPEIVRDRAPEFTQWWENFVNTNKQYGKAIRAAQKGMTDWFNQDLIDRAKSKIGGESSGSVISDALDNFWDNNRQAIFDDLHGLLRMETELTGERVAMPLGPYETARLSRAAYSIVDGALRYGPPVRVSKGRWDFVDRNGNPSTILKNGKTIANPKWESWGLDDVLEPVSRELDEWIMYATGRSAQELMGQGRENLFTQAEIDAMLDAGRGKPHFAKVFADYQKWNGKILDFAESMGLIDPQARKLWRRKAYIPFYRVGQNQGGTKRKGGTEGNVTVTHMLTGGTDNLNDILDNMIQNASRLIVESIKNDARLQMVDFANQVKGGGRFLTRISKGSKAVQIDKRQVQNTFLESMGINAKAYRTAQKIGQSDPTIDIMLAQMDDQMEDFVKFFMFGQEPRGDNIIAVKRAGKTEFYEVADPLLYRAFSSLNRTGPKHPLVRGLNAFRRLGQTSITLTLDFMTANMWRDTLHAWVFSRHGFKPILDSVRGMGSRVKNDPAYREFIANGGGMASYLVDPDAFESHVRHFYNKKGIDARWVLSTPKKLLLGLETLVDAAEMSTRIGQYRKAIKYGATPRHAAYSAREISVDFSMRGDSELMNVAYNSVLFLKAAMNSMDRVYRGLTKDVNRGHVWAKTGMIAMASVGLYLLARGLPEYEDLEDWDKDTHWHVFIPKNWFSWIPFVDEPTNQVGERFIHIRLPKIWEIGAIATGAERSMETYLDQLEENKDVNWGKYGSRMWKIFLDLFKMEYIPQAIEPLVETYWMNKNRFTGRDIVPEYMQELEPFAQYTPYTNKTLVDLAELTANLPKELQFSPARAQALASGYLNTWGYYGLFFMDEMRHGDDLPAWRLDQYPVLKRFTRDHPLRRTHYEKEFWDFYRESATLYKTMDEMIDRNKPEIAERKAEKEMTQAHQIAASIARKAKGFNQAMLEIYDDPQLTPDQKRQQLDQLQRDKNQMFKDAMTDLSTIE